VEAAGAVDIERTWSRIEAWMATHAAEALDALRPGVCATTLSAAEESLTVELPQSLRRSLRRHDGQEWRWPSLIGFGILMPLEKMVVTGRQNERWGVDEIAGGEDAWWRRGWVPFVSRDGDCLSVASGSGGEGEVWCFRHDMDPMHSVVAPDFGTWLERWADELEADVFELDRAAGAGLLPRDGRTSRLWPAD
jgi:cell wall assembly regulator SMI1